MIIEFILAGVLSGTIAWHVSLLQSVGYIWRSLNLKIPARRSVFTSTRMQRKAVIYTLSIAFFWNILGVSMSVLLYFITTSTDYVFDYFAVGNLLYLVLILIISLCVLIFSYLFLTDRVRYMLYQTVIGIAIFGVLLPNLAVALVKY